MRWLGTDCFRAAVAQIHALDNAVAYRSAALDYPLAHDGVATETRRQANRQRATLACMKVRLDL